MSGIFFLDWAALAVSLFNTILLLWLGLTVLLNAEQRHWGIWMTGGGLLGGALFFLSHTAILGYGVYAPLAGDFWWRLGWVPVILAPYAWYAVMLWYAGAWEPGAGAVACRHRPWLILLGAATLALLALAGYASPLPSFAVMAGLERVPAAVTGWPVLLLYPPFILACMGLSLEALARPGPTLRLMGGQARRRANPWLFVASLTLLLVGLLVAGFIGWVALAAQRAWLPLDALDSPGPLPPRLGTLVTGLDLLIAGLIGLAVLLIGQAITAYEIFTGRTLPRRGLQRYWRRAVILAAGYSAAVSLSLTLGLPTIYSLLVSAGLMTLFYALVSWRSYAERQRLLDDLRPFVVSSQLYARLLSGGPGPAALPDDPVTGVQASFDALCRQVLNARRAALSPRGSLAPLFGEALWFGLAGEAPGLPSALEAGRVEGPPDVLCVPLEGEHAAGMRWAVPLWNERGLCGVLWLGDKADDGPYTQEEMEIARAAGERLVDLQASAEMARRLMDLQRRQLAESQVIDQRTRRAIHDEVLPRLHAALLALGASGAALAPGEDDPQALLIAAHRQLSGLLRDLPSATTPAAVRLGLGEALRQVIQDEFKGAFDQVSWQITPAAEARAGQLSPVQAEVIFYAAREAIRNAARHARARHLSLALQGDDPLEVWIRDNGVGMGATADGEKPAGHGLALHSTLLAVLGGSLAIEPSAAWSTQVVIRLPLH